MHSKPVPDTARICRRQSVRRSSRCLSPRLRRFRGSALCRFSQTGSVETRPLLRDAEARTSGLAPWRPGRVGLRVALVSYSVWRDHGGGLRSGLAGAGRSAAPRVRAGRWPRPGCRWWPSSTWAVPRCRAWPPSRSSTVTSWWPELRCPRRRGAGRPRVPAAGRARHPAALGVQGARAAGRDEHLRGRGRFAVAAQPPRGTDMLANPGLRDGTPRSSAGSPRRPRPSMSTAGERTR